MHNAPYSSRFRSVRLLNHLDQPTTQLENERSAKIQMVAEITDTILFDIFFEIRLWRQTPQHVTGHSHLLMMDGTPAGCPAVPTPWNGVLLGSRSVPASIYWR